MADEYNIFENGELRPATPEEIAEIEARAAAAEANALPLATDAFNTERAAKLAETDWWAIRASEPSGTPMTDDQLAYRAALRAMDDAEDFDPFNPVWPESPSS
tara:strand:- start:150 stop:458 length:309 start_codon:yes stop_codon:yes gene_type:complete